MKKIFRVCSLGLILVYMFALCACNSKNSSNNGNNQTTSTSEQTSSVVTTETTEETTTETTIPETTVEVPKAIYGNGPEQINLWSYNSELLDCVRRYLQIHPEFGEKYSIVCSIYSQSYQAMLNQTLPKGGPDAPDIYAVEAGSVAEYTKGKMAKYAATYKQLGIDVDEKIKAAEIQQYTVDVGTRDGEVIALSYKNNAGLMIYRFSIAKKVFGTGDPSKIEEIFGAGTGKLDKLLDAAAKLKKNGYALVSSPDEVWNLCDGAATTPWVVNGEIDVAPERAAYLDIGKQLVSNGYTNNTAAWTQEWFNDMKGKSKTKVFAYFQPEWFLSYTLASNAAKTSGDWRVCAPPAGFFTGGEWILAREGTTQKEGVAQLIEWITLDTSKTGYQYLLANDKTAKAPVVSNVVMRMSVYKPSVCKGQDLYPVIVKSSQYVSAKNIQKSSFILSTVFVDNAKRYFSGGIDDKDKAISSFKSMARDRYGMFDE